MKADKLNHYGYNTYLKPNATALRKRMTKAEACLWKYVLKAQLMKGYEFRRQRPVLNYIADFMCFELKLIIEVDGLTHHWEEVQAKDEIRELALQKAGFTVLRFNDDSVLHDIDNVVRTIIGVIENIEEKTENSFPPP